MSQPVVIKSAHGNASIVAARAGASVRVSVQRSQTVERSNAASVKANLERASEIQKQIAVPGPAVDLEYVTGSPIGAHKVVRQQADGRIILADRSDPASRSSVSGLTISAASDVGHKVRVRESGPMEFSGWNFVPESEVFLGENGGLTQVPPTEGFLLSIGYAATPTIIHVRIGRAVKRT